MSLLIVEGQRRVASRKRKIKKFWNTLTGGGEREEIQLINPFS